MSASGLRFVFPIPSANGCLSYFLASKFPKYCLRKFSHPKQSFCHHAQCRRSHVLPRLMSLSFFDKKLCLENSLKCCNLSVFSADCRVNEMQKTTSNVYIGVRSMAGHSKWQNVKHIKTEKDQIKSKMCARIAMLARHAIKYGGSNPKLNNKLADVYELAMKNNVPVSVIESALKKATTGKVIPGFIEIAGPGGCLILLDYETDSVSTLRHDIKCVIKKYNSSIMQGEGRWRSAYEQKGVLKIVGKTNGNALDSESALNSAIEAGAEDVQLRNDEEQNENYLEFFCDPSDLHKVKKELENMMYKIEDFYVGYIPNAFAELYPEDMRIASNLLSDLENLTDIIRIFENIK